MGIVVGVGCVFILTSFFDSDFKFAKDHKWSGLCVSGWGVGSEVDVFHSNLSLCF